MTAAVFCSTDASRFRQRAQSCFNRNVDRRACLPRLAGARSQSRTSRANDLAGGAILGFWSRAKNWSEERRKRTGQDEFLEWCEWLATQIVQSSHRATLCSGVFAGGGMTAKR